ncbi:hypothetical+protein [Methylocapsa aurea]|uniref:hypothetical protein n=1 Tax=Methylocapsa aurea TaxID=663610 RepID=UPI003D18DB9E
MRAIGSPDEWVDLIDSMVPDILALVASTWPQMGLIDPASREDPITERLCRLLRMNRDAAELPFNIHIQQVELDPSAGEDQGRLDIAFSPLVPREDIYFCLECKRLNVPTPDGTRSYASEYLTKGMIRFVRGQYAKRVKHGCMLGYVFDGDFAGAFGAITRVIRLHIAELGMNSPGTMLKSSIRPSDSRCRETHHRRNKLPAITLHHFLTAT